MEQSNEKILPIREWQLSQEQVNKIKASIREQLLAEEKEKISQKLEEMKAHIQQLPRNDFIPVEEEPFVFSTNPEARMLVEDVDRLKVGLTHTFFSHDYMYEPGEEKRLKKIDGISWLLCSQDQACKLCDTLHWSMDLEERLAKGIYKNYSFYYTSTGISASWNNVNLKNIDLCGLSLRGGEFYRFSDKKMHQFNDYDWGLVADLYVLEVPDDEHSLPYILKQGFTPEEGEDPNFWKALAILLSEDLVSIDVNDEKTAYDLKYKEGEISPEVLESLAEGWEDGSCITSYFQLFDLDKKVEEIFAAKEVGLEELFEELLNGDRTRCNLKPYSMKQLTDPKRGGWDLWETQQPTVTEQAKQCKLEETVYARDPRQDISERGLIGIDFGTKSTVVTYMEGARAIRPLRIGTENPAKEVSKDDYENPTVMEFINIQQFLKDYGARKGRPYTQWEDVTVSHTAAEVWKENTNPDDCAAFLKELKQWAGAEGRIIHVRDEMGHEKTLRPYMTLQEGDFDPIEIYAYYIGLYLNNQHMGKIYMHYILSFPVTYSPKVQDRIKESFERGLRKSLPPAVVNDAKSMEKFRVEKGASEPAAYAACALQELEKKKAISVSVDQPVFYGVFDFGGGTSDFDFGTWKKADRENKKERSYDRVIRHFGASGKQYLGGENLLKQLAYQVVKENAKNLRKEQIPFVQAPECAHFSGDEGIIMKDSQEAETNMQRLMEKLRPFWERKTEEAPSDLGQESDAPQVSAEESDGVQDANESKCYTLDKLTFFKTSGKKADNVTLTVNVEKLEKVLEEKLKEGIKAFFDKLLLVRTEYHMTDVCHILLAGRSSQSPLFQKFFRESMKKYEDDFKEENAEPGIEEVHLFELHKPLGSESEEADLERPNEKTGVAFGLLQCRDSGRIKVISETDTASFRFYVGREEEGYFQAILTPSSPCDTWQEFEYAMRRDNEFYYTTNPSAGLNGKNALSCNHLSVHLEVFSIPKEAVNEDAMIYWRPTGPKTLEYVVAESEEKCKAGEYTFAPKTISLGE